MLGCQVAAEGPTFKRLSRISTGDIGANQDQSSNNSEINNSSMERKKYLNDIRKYVNRKRRANSSMSNNYSHDSISNERTTLSRNIFGGVNDDDRHNKEPKEYNKSNPPSPPKYTYHPSAAPTSVPTFPPTDSPTKNPSSRPTLPPSQKPTNKPTKSQSSNPTKSPTKPPSSNPTQTPTQKVIVSKPTLSPTKSSPVFQKQCNLLQFGNTTALEPTILTFSYEIETDPGVSISVTDDVVPCVEGAISSMLAASLSFKDVVDTDVVDTDVVDTDVVDTDVVADATTGKGSTLIYKNDRRMLTEIVGLSSQPEDTLEKDCE